MVARPEREREREREREINGFWAKSLGLEYRIKNLDDGTWSVTAPDCWIVNHATADDAKAAADKHFAEQVRSVLVE